jgi:hypothetical protein
MKLYDTRRAGAKVAGVSQLWDFDFEFGDQTIGELAGGLADSLKTWQLSQTGFGEKPPRL